MGDSVKFIFKTLIKVPVIICVSYLIFNIFAFTFSYFRLMGLSYVVLQTAVENNYIPYDGSLEGDSEGSILLRYLNSLETQVLDKLTIACDTDVTNNTECISIDDPTTNGENRRVQYGTPIKVTVSADYTFIFPLINPHRTNNTNSLYNEGNQADAMELNYHEYEGNNIKISYTVPGLKYYPDLS